jgi:hypothetical protein
MEITVTDTINIEESLRSDERILPTFQPFQPKSKETKKLKD